MQERGEWERDEKKCIKGKQHFKNSDVYSLL